jgi:ribonuclease P protein component
VPRSDESSPVRAGFSVPKKKFRKSVHRHRMRRLLVEAWRLGKHELYPAIPADLQLHIFIMYTGSELVDFTTLQPQVQKAIAKLAQEFTQHA